jgi:SAM-dependent methyltransferase
MYMRDAEVREWLDAENLDEPSLRRNLADIRHINAWLGWTHFAVAAVMRHVRRARLQTFSLLDVACGSADIPLAIAQRAERLGLRPHIVGTDLSPQIVAIARQHTAGSPAMSVERQDALALSFPDGSFDIGLCTLALHHFDPAQAATLLRNLKRVSRHVLVFDVARSRAAYAGAVLLTRLTPMDRMTRHDAPASVRRAYSLAELRAIALAAGMEDARTWMGFPFRLALEATGTP